MNTIPNHSLKDDIGVLADNYKSLNSHKDAIDVKRKALLLDLAHLMLPFMNPMKEQAIDVYQDFVSRVPTMDVIEKMELCRRIAASLDMIHPFSPAMQEDREVLPPDFEKITYVASPYSDTLLKAFRSALRAPRYRAEEEISFLTVCENVYHGNARYAILPIENSTDGKLLSFYSLIDQYELKILYVYDLIHPNDESTKFALLGKSLAYPEKKWLDRSWFEFSIHTDHGNDLAPLLQAASLCHLDVRRVDAIPHKYWERSFVYYVTVQTNHTDFVPYMLFLALEYPQYTPIGIFYHSEISGGLS